MPDKSKRSSGKGVTKPVREPQAKPSPKKALASGAANPAIRETMCYRVGFDVTLREMRDWPPGRIAQFFRGIAMSIKAREGMPYPDPSEENVPSDTPALPLPNTQEPPL